MSDTPKHHRRWFQYSLRTLFLLMLLVSIGMSWVAVKKQQGRREREVAAAIEKMGGYVAWSPLSQPQWLRRLLGDDFFCSVYTVSLYRTDITDAGLEHLKALRQLIGLTLSETQVTDASLVHLKTLTRLAFLHLDGTRVTDVGLAHLTVLNQLYRLSLDDTPVTDAGLEHLRQLKAPPSGAP
jgi:hypothetical protein